MLVWVERRSVCFSVCCICSRCVESSSFDYYYDVLPDRHHLCWIEEDPLFVFFHRSLSLLWRSMYRLLSGEAQCIVLQI